MTAALLLLCASLAADRPNVVVFLVDDLGQRDLGCYGSTFYETPNVDRLARDGMRFTQAYAACPVCSPTRASLLTGQWPQRTGITDYIDARGGNQPEQWKRNTPLLPAAYSDRLALSATTLAELVRPAGYATFFAGKWHLGPEGFWPENQGFDFNLGGTEAGGPYGGSKYFSPYKNPRLPDGPAGEHLPDRLATETCQFIASHRDKPFLAYLSFYSVHTPLIAREDLKAKYEAKAARLGIKPEFRWDTTRDVRQNQTHAVYAAMVEAMDLAVGKVLAQLDELGLAENTLVVFTSDNGGLSTSEGSPTSNEPLRCGKGWLYEGGIRTAFVVRWPRVTPKGAESETPISSPDLYATIASATGTEPPPAQPRDGIDLTPVLRGEKGLERNLYWHYPHYGNQGGAPGSAIRKGDWKLIEWAEDLRFELYRLSDDPSETRDLSGTETVRAMELRAELRAWRDTVGATYPAANPAFDPSKPRGREVPREPRAGR